MQKQPELDLAIVADDPTLPTQMVAALPSAQPANMSDIVPAVCPVCGTVEAQALCVVNDYRVLRCAVCASDFVSPAPDAAALRAYYDRPAWFEGGEPGGYANYDAQTVPLLPFFDAILDQFGADVQGRSILDIGCGYGTHLEQAHRRGWKCFGVEVSAHARQVIDERHGRKFFVVDDVEHLIPHAFDLVVMFDVIEHLADPYRLFYTLFAQGAITPDTKVVIATPNARSISALADPSGWPYRHPPSHLVYFSGQALSLLLQRLRFTSVEVQGLHAERVAPAQFYTDEDFALNRRLAGFGGLYCEASGSDFGNFMQERYVPGTWSRLAEYEHLPRYLFARELAAGRKVLDFGCGTGYGTSILAQSAQTIIGIDIDSSALAWAREHHKKANLSYQQRADLGAALPAKSFDFISCFEMIEHVPETTQIEAIRNFARLLCDDGMAVISTPNPEITKLYGANPYHVREMNRTEFVDLLGQHFAHVTIFEQFIQPSVLIAKAATGQHSQLRPLTWAAADASVPEPAVFLAVCSHRPLPPIEGACFLDFRSDFIADQLRDTEHLNRTRFAQFQAAEEAGALDLRLQDAAATHIRTEEVNARIQAQLQAEILRLNQAMAAAEQTAQLQANEIQRLTASSANLNHALIAKERELADIRQGNWYKLGETLHQKLSLKKLAKLAYYSAACLTPSSLKPALKPLAAKLKRRYQQQANPAAAVKPHVVRQRPQRQPGRPRVLHVIANFMLGGSSRLVVDLIEELGDTYQHKVVTSYLPSPPAYVGVDVVEIRSPQSPEDVLDFLYDYNPTIVHVHYWGDTDWGWYDIFFRAVQTLGCRVIENINTPVDAYKADFVDRYVHVSNYVQQHFGDGSARNMTIYPGSDFGLFTRPANQPLPADCLGMVYRLETDKLNLQSIDVFVKVAQRRPQTRVLIVGGGSYLEPYRQAAQAAGVVANFEFTGYVDYAKLPALYERMSIFVAPVWKESFGQVSPFAMNFGIPVAGYEVGGLSEIVDDPAMLAPPGDSDALADLLIALLDDPARCRQIGERNHARAQNLFSVEAMNGAYRALYAELAEAAEAKK